jgi:hypothetical protein
VKKVLTGVVALALFAAGCGGSSDSEELAQVRAELDALKEQVATTTAVPTTTTTTTTTTQVPPTSSVDPFELEPDAEEHGWVLASDAGWVSLSLESNSPLELANGGLETLRLILSCTAFYPTTDTGPVIELQVGTQGWSMDRPADPAEIDRGLEQLGWTGRFHTVEDENGRTRNHEIRVKFDTDDYRQIQMRTGGWETNHLIWSNYENSAEVVVELLSASVLAVEVTLAGMHAQLAIFDVVGLASPLSEMLKVEPCTSQI